MNSDFTVLQKEVKEFRDRLKHIRQENSTVEDLYKGCFILYSKWFENPDVLFIGINPGSGRYHGKKNVEKTKEFWNELDENKDGFEYLLAKERNYDYRLASETRRLFEIAGCYNCLQNSMKSNYYFIATDTQKDLSVLRKALGPQLDKEFRDLSRKWTKFIIEGTKPKLVIGEGKWITEKLASIYDAKVYWEGSVGTFESNGISFLGYKRVRSNIKHKELVAEKLKQVVA